MRQSQEEGGRALGGNCGTGVGREVECKSRAGCVLKVYTHVTYEFTRMVDTRLPAKGSSNCHGARPVYQIILMTKWLWTSRLSTKNYLFLHEFNRLIYQAEGGEAVDDRRGTKERERAREKEGGAEREKERERE